MTCDKVAVLLAADGRKRRYPIPVGVDVQDHYVIDGTTYQVVAVFSDPVRRPSGAAMTNTQ